MMHKYTENNLISFKVNNNRIFRIINKIIPDCFDLSHSRCGKTIRTTRQILARANISYTEFEHYIDDEVCTISILKINVYKILF